MELDFLKSSLAQKECCIPHNSFSPLIAKYNFSSAQIQLKSPLAEHLLFDILCR